MPKESKTTFEKVWKEYDKGLGFNTQLDLNETVRQNENFFIGRQWEDVESNGLPTPVFNFLKRVVLFTVASVTSNNLKMNASPMGAFEKVQGIVPIADVINAEFTRLFETNKVTDILREYMRNAAVDGDGCTYTYWNPDIETGQASKGAIVTEIIENTRVFFGNANDRRVQRQPYIIISSREMIDEVKDRAKDNGSKEWESITVDTDERNINSENATDDKVTVLLKLWKNKETKTIWGYECTKNATVREAWDLGLKLYPVTWLNWDYVQDNYHGQAMITGLIPNQIFINKLFAMSMISLMTTAYPKIVYDKTRLNKWDNRVGAAIPINGGDVGSVAKIIDPAQISPQIAQFIQLAVEMTQTNLGATAVAMGDTRPDNTSAIIALQRAASTPSEITKQNLYQSLEDLGRIYMDFMGEYYGTRTVDIAIPKEMAQIAQFAGVGESTNTHVDYDFSTLKAIYCAIKLDVGASAYWSEIASMQTLDNLLMQGKIGVDDYLERIPDGYITKRQELLDKIRGSQGLPIGEPVPGMGGNPSEVIAGGSPTPIPNTAGNSPLQREIVKGAAMK